MTEHLHAASRTRVTDGGVVNDAGIDERHRVLADPYRRATLDVLDDVTDRIQLTNLAIRVTRVLSPNADTTSLTPTSRRVEETAIVLHHNHLPRLVDAGFLEYDATSKWIVVAHDDQ